MPGIGVRPGQMHDRVGELAAFSLIEIAHFEENLRHDVLVEAGLARRRYRNVLPLQPAG